jgi:DNA-directed RNA polymerase subunit RPC12/RpoP
MKQAISLTELESFDTHAKRHGSERRFLCPVCGSGKPRDDAHRSMALNTDTGAYICHRCGEKGLIKEKWTTPTFTPRKVRVAAALARAFSVEPTPQPTQEIESDCEAKLSQVLKDAVPVFGTAGAKYIEKRGIPIELASPANVLFSTDFYGRPAVLFPMHNRDGELVAFNGRFTDGKESKGKLKTQSVGKKSFGLFATHGALESEIITVCEGVFDALSLHLCGLPAVAIVGTSFPEWLSSALAFQKVFVATDADESGDKAAESLVNVLRSRGARAVRMRPEGAKDWNDVLLNNGADALREFVELRIGEAFPDFEYEPVTESEPVTEDFAIEDVFDVENESGQLALGYLFDAAKNHDSEELLWGMPTVRAYQAGKDLVAGVGKHSQGKLTDAQLKALGDRYINAHLRSDNVSLPWTGKDLPLFHLSITATGERLENLTCNQIQSWIVREHWLRQSPETQIDIMSL